MPHPPSQYSYGSEMLDKQYTDHPTYGHAPFPRNPQDNRSLSSPNPTTTQSHAFTGHRPPCPSRTLATFGSDFILGRSTKSWTDDFAAELRKRKDEAGAITLDTFISDFTKFFEPKFAKR